MYQKGGTAWTTSGHRLHQNVYWTEQYWFFSHVLVVTSSDLDLSSSQFSPSNNWAGGCLTFLNSVTCLGLMKLGWLVEESSLAHILSVMTTLFCFSVIRCMQNKKRGKLLSSVPLYKGLENLRWCQDIWKSYWSFELNIRVFTKLETPLIFRFKRCL